MGNVRSRMSGETIPAEVPVELSQDPDKLLEQPVPDTPVIEAVVEPVVEPVVVAPVIKRYEYQVRDEQGRTLGGKQVIEYTDEADLQKKWAAKEELLVRRLREVTRKQRLGIDDTDLPAEAELSPNIVQLEEKQLTNEEIFQLSQDMNDPAKFMDARDRLLESSLGCTPAALRDMLNKQQMEILSLSVKDNYLTFERSNTDFYPCPENKQTLTDWMVKKGLAPSVNNFKLAHTTLKEAGLLLEAPVREVIPAIVAPTVVEDAPVVNAEPKPSVPVVAPDRIVSSQPPQQRQPVRVPSGLNDRVSSSTSQASPRTSLTIAEFEAMPSDELKKRLRTDPSFKQMVEELYKKPNQPQI